MSKIISAVLLAFSLIFTLPALATLSHDYDDGYQSSKNFEKGSKKKRSERRRNRFREKLSWWDSFEEELSWPEYEPEKKFRLTEGSKYGGWWEDDENGKNRHFGHWLRKGLKMLWDLEQYQHWLRDKDKDGGYEEPPTQKPDYEEPTVVPVPAAAYLFGGALLGVGILRHRRIMS